MKPTLVIDLDNTLIFSDVLEMQQYDLKFENLFIKKREFASEFLKETSQYFNLIIWSAGEDDYVKYITNNLFSNISFEQILTRKDCKIKKIAASIYDTFPDTYYIKDLKLLNIPLENILAVDDRKISFDLQQDNLILVKGFYGQEIDAELDFLKTYIISIKDNKNFLEINKYNWCSDTVKSEIKKIIKF